MMRQGRPPLVLTLPQLATRINALAEEILDKRMEMCRLIAQAQDRVVRETDMTFLRWAAENLRKSNGTPWSPNTLYKMAMFGREPDKLTVYRANIARLGRGQRVLARVRTSNVAEQVNLLMTAWEQADDDARRQFLHLIGAEFLRHAG